MTPAFTPNVMRNKFGADAYASPVKKAVNWPTPSFLLATLFGPMLWLWQMARRKHCDDCAWNYGSAWLADIFENTGGRIIIDGLGHIASLDEPCVIIANHMSTLETFLLPAIIRPHRPVTFIVKESLTTMPVFGPIMRSRDPVVVKRQNPREDLAVVMEDGVKRLQNGISVIVFPQHTRSMKFDADNFNSIGVKLARKANAPAIPLALKTDAWGQGKRVKELGRIRPDLPARFLFGQPLRVTGNGKKEHADICGFIGAKVAEWQKSDGINA